MERNLDIFLDASAIYYITKCFSIVGTKVFWNMDCEWIVISAQWMLSEASEHIWLQIWCKCLICLRRYDVKLWTTPRDNTSYRAVQTSSRTIESVLEIISVYKFVWIKPTSLSRWLHQLSSDPRYWATSSVDSPWINDHPRLTRNHMRLVFLTRPRLGEVSAGSWCGS